MTPERFNQLLNGPLQHPLPIFAIMRLQLALLSVLEATGETGDKALERYCAQREAEDKKGDC